MHLAGAGAGDMIKLQCSEKFHAHPECRRVYSVRQEAREEI